MAQSIEAYFDNTGDFYTATDSNTHATTVQDQTEVNHEGFFENLFENTAMLALIGFIAVIALVVYFFKRR